MTRWLLSFARSAISAAVAPLAFLASLRRSGGGAWRWGRRAPEHDGVTIGADLR